MKLKLEEVATLNISRVLTAEGERVNIENILEDVTLTLKDEIYRNQVNIITEFNTSEIIFSRKSLRSIVYNLLSNAIAYKKPGIPVEIYLKTEKVNGSVMLSIKDNGVGIDKQNHEIIFERYTRIITEVEGTGMGLYLVRTLVENSGGKVEIESTPGEGSTFKVHFKI